MENLLGLLTRVSSQMTRIDIYYAYIKFGIIIILERIRRFGCVLGVTQLSKWWSVLLFELT
jgi:hypothetical protein